MSDLQTFQCPNCQKFINDTMTSCKYCSTPLDTKTIVTAVANQNKVNEAYNSASNLRIFAGTLIPLFFLRFIPFLGIIAQLVFLTVLVLTPLILIYWQIRYGRIKTTDTEFKQAKKYWVMALVIWLVFVLLQIFLTLLFLGLLRGSSG